MNDYDSVRFDSLPSEFLLLQPDRYAIARPVILGGDGPINHYKKRVRDRRKWTVKTFSKLYLRSPLSALIDSMPITLNFP